MCFNLVSAGPTFRVRRLGLAAVPVKGSRASNITVIVYEPALNAHTDLGFTCEGSEGLIFLLCHARVHLLWHIAFILED